MDLGDMGMKELMAAEVMVGAVEDKKGRQVGMESILNLRWGWRGHGGDTRRSDAGSGGDHVGVEFLGL